MEVAVFLVRLKLNAIAILAYTLMILQIPVKNASLTVHLVFHKLIVFPAKMGTP